MVKNMEDNGKKLIESIIDNKGVNVQTLITGKPFDKEDTIKLYLVSKKHGLKSFKVNETLSLIMNRESCGCSFGTTTNKDEKDKIGLVLVWE